MASLARPLGGVFLADANPRALITLRGNTDMFIRVFIFFALFSFAEISKAQMSTNASPVRQSDGLVPWRARTAPSASPSLEQRVADLEAYVNNSARGADAANAQVASNISGAGPGHNAWMMTAAALVLFMTLPGLALFYGGLVRAKNVLSILAQCLGIAGLVAILWWAVGYSLVFSHGSPFFGGLQFAFLRGVDAQPSGDYSFWVSQNIFAMYQLMFAIITPALIIGAVAERMRYAAVLVFVAVWMFAVYFPLAYMVWGIDGLMNSPAAPSCTCRPAGPHLSSVFCSGRALGFEKKSWHRTAWCFAWSGPECCGSGGTDLTPAAHSGRMVLPRTHS